MTNVKVTKEMLITKMSTLVVYVVFMCEIISVQSNTDVEKRFVQDVTLNGHICQEGHVVFQVNFSKVSCSVKCMEYPACTGIFYNSDSNQCTGCASRNYVTNVTEQQFTYYKLEMKCNFILPVWSYSPEESVNNILAIVKINTRCTFIFFFNA